MCFNPRKSAAKFGHGYPRASHTDKYYISALSAYPAVKSRKLNTLYVLAVKKFFENK